jgi:hypothetical protein
MLAFYRRGAFEQGMIGAAELWRAFDKTDRWPLVVAADAG